MAQNSKITDSRAASILSDIFKSGNTLALSTSDPNSSFSEPSAESYKRYEIKSGDFKISGGVATTANHLLYGLATESWGTIQAFGVFNGNTLIYWGLLNSSVSVPVDTVPVFKIYNDAANEGIRVTLDVASTASASA